MSDDDKGSVVLRSSLIVGYERGFGVLYGNS